MNQEAIEKEIVEKGLTAPRITPNHVASTIVAESYHRFEGTTVTVCCLTLKNGFNVVGHSACASLSNFDEALGRKIALDDAQRQIWQLEGYLLRQHLHESENQHLP